MRARLALLFVLAASACAEREGFVAHAPLPPAPAVCPLGGCASAAPRAAACVGCDDGARACDERSPERCTARAFDKWAARGAAASLEDVVALFERACDLGDPEGCAYAGRLLLEGRGVARDVGRGTDLLERACDDGALRACDAILRRRYAERSAKIGPWTQTRQQMQATCLRGEGNSCFYVGLYFERGTNGFPHDPRRGAAWYQRGCDLGERVSCNNLANDHYYGDGVAQDFAAAARLYERACREGEPVGCANVGFISEYGDGVPLDMKRAAEMYAIGCSGQSAYACLHAEMIEEYRKGVPHDPVKAVEKWRRACDARDAKACAYLDALSVLVHHAEVRARLRVAYLGVMYEDGKGVARDEARALALMKKACGQAVKLGCAWMREHGGGS